MNRAVASVLLVCSRADRGGMQSLIGFLAGGLASHGVRVTIAVGGSRDLPESVSHALNGYPELVDLHRLDDPVGLKGWIRWTRSLRRLVSRTKPDIIHGHGMRTALPLVVAGRRRPREILVTTHGLLAENITRTVLVTRLSRVRVAAVSPSLVETLAKHHLTADFLPVGVPDPPPPLSREEIAKEFGVDPSLPLCVFIGRLSGEKDPWTALDAVEGLPQVSLLMIGGGPLERDLRGAVFERGLSGRIVVCGWRGDARSILGVADVLVVTSRREGQPLIVAEAAMAGVPVVSTSWDGAATWLTDGEDALLAPIGDASAVRQSISQILESPTLRTTMHEASQRLGNAHRLTSMVDAHLSLYEAILN